MGIRKDALRPRCGKWMPVAKQPCARPSGHKGDCRTLAATEYMRNINRSTKYKANFRARAVRYRAHWTQVLDALKLSRGCESCGFRNERPGFFDLDHVDPSDKFREMSTLAGACNPEDPVHVQRFMQELDKCQVLCVACHREKTARHNERRAILMGTYHGEIPDDDE